MRTMTNLVLGLLERLPPVLAGLTLLVSTWGLVFAVALAMPALMH
jgi:hypothetical protein